MAATQIPHTATVHSANSHAAAVAGDGRGDPAQRVDAAHALQQHRRSTAATTADRESWRAREPSGEGSQATAVPSLLLPHHAQDLIARLQAWAGDLDCREAELNAQKARQETLERSFRLWSESQQQQLQQLEREATRLRDQLKQQARRLALSQ